MKLKFSTIVTFIFFQVTTTWAQTQTQTIRGTIKDQDAQIPLFGATVRVIGTDPIQGAVSDMQGNFRIEAVALGRISLLVTYMGYEDKVIPDVLVTSAKEVILHLTLLESIEKLDAVVVIAQKSKDEVLNEMALVSARTFSVEETQRYAGALSDPARMVSAFAGVTGSAEGNNDIVVRGNSPRGIMWRLEGVEIPNPNHFANEGATGGPVNTLNSNILDNSDFFSGAFSPEYGNALSGVFDIRFKKGNNERREYAASASVLGVDFTAEGPFKEGYNGSYIANYRYSSLQLLSGLGILDFGGIPKYQDASFNAYLPINKKQFVSVFGLGGKSNIKVEEQDENGNNAFRGNMFADLGIMGVSHTYFFSDRLFIKNTLTGSGTLLKGVDEFTNESYDYYRYANTNMTRSTVRYAALVNFKINAKHKLEGGWIYSAMGFNMQADRFLHETQQLTNVLSDEGSTNVLQGYLSWKYRAGENWTLINGAHFLRFGLNGSQLIEPRMAAKWSFSKNQSLNFGFGLHSKVESVSTYLAKSTQDDGSVVIPNRNLTPTRAAHFVLGFDQMINPTTHLKVETYYQHLFDVPVEAAAGSTFSILNLNENYITERMINQGTGRNFGLEFTVEQYLNRGLYYLGTLSLYQSYFTPQDGIERQTAFNGNYVSNFLIGKEWKTRSTKADKIMFMNAKVSLIGGSPYTPIDLIASIAAREEIRDTDNPYSRRGDDIFFINYSIGTRKNKKNTTREFKIDITNVTNNQAKVNEYYVPSSESIIQSPQLPFIPNLVYSFKF